MAASVAFESPVALVTGGARRIGAVIVEALHQAGYRVMIHCHQSVDAAQATAARLNHVRSNSAWVCTADLANQASYASIIEQTLHVGSRLDVLVNNASLFTKDPLAWEALFAINVKAPYFLSLQAAPYLSQHQGCIVNITDQYATRVLKDYAVYCQTKAALGMQTKALARQLAPLVRVNAVAPGAVIWPEGENALSPAQQQHIIEKIWLKRHGDPKYIAQAVLFLVNNRFMTGQSIGVEGGRDG